VTPINKPLHKNFEKTMSEHIPSNYRGNLLNTKVQLVRRYKNSFQSSTWVDGEGMNKTSEDMGYIYSKPTKLSSKVKSPFKIIREPLGRALIMFLYLS
jgi:hypothetical protein